jgi:CBS domain-containing protein
MMGTPYHCSPETNLGLATELMWIGNCGFLPVVGQDNKVTGVITDRDICVALGTRDRTAGNVTVGEVMSGKLFACAPEDEIETALEAMRAACQ